MPVEIKDMTFDKVAIGPVSVRVYQGAEYAKGAPVLLYFHGGAFTETGLKHCPLAECIASTDSLGVQHGRPAPWFHENLNPRRTNHASGQQVGDSTPGRSRLSTAGPLWWGDASVLASRARTSRQHQVT